MKYGYDVVPAKVGDGFVVFAKTGWVDPGANPEITAAFSSAVDLLTWLAKQHGLPVVKASPTSDIVVSINGEDAPASTGLVDAVRKAVEGRKFREPVPVDGEWIGHNGIGVPTTVQRVEVSFRNGEEKSGYVSEFIRWEYADVSTAPYDILAYRIVS